MKVENTLQEFILLFRMDIITKGTQPSPKQMKIYMQQWNEWVGGIAAQKKLSGGNHLSTKGKVLKPGKVVTAGPYTANKESVAGYILVKAKDLNEAVSIAKSCPILHGKGTSVEVRKIDAPKKLRAK
jgi:hypothetical protein